MNSQQISKRENERLKISNCQSERSKTVDLNKNSLKMTKILNSIALTLILSVLTPILMVSAFLLGVLLYIHTLTVTARDGSRLLKGKILHVMFKQLPACAVTVKPLIISLFDCPASFFLTVHLRRPSIFSL